MKPLKILKYLKYGKVNREDLSLFFTIYFCLIVNFAK